MAKRKPRTAWELCERVCEAIAAHPGGYLQEMWVTRGKKVIGRAMSASLPRKEICGTAFCRAGWLIEVADGAGAAAAMACSWEARANALLGVPHSATHNLFAASALGALKPGTKAYVREGIAGLRRFMKAHEAHLKARVLKGL